MEKNIYVPMLVLCAVSTSVLVFILVKFMRFLVRLEEYHWGHTAKAGEWHKGFYAWLWRVLGGTRRTQNDS